MAGHCSTHRIGRSTFDRIHCCPWRSPRHPALGHSKNASPEPSLVLVRTSPEIYMLHSAASSRLSQKEVHNQTRRVRAVSRVECREPISHDTIRTQPKVTGHRFIASVEHR